MPVKADGAAAPATYDEEGRAATTAGRDNGDGAEGSGCVGSPAPREREATDEDVARPPETGAVGGRGEIPDARGEYDEEDVPRIGRKRCQEEKKKKEGINSMVLELSNSSLLFSVFFPLDFISVFLFLKKKITDCLLSTRKTSGKNIEVIFKNPK